MRLNVNGAKIWSRGANLIPMDEMDGRLTENAYYYMLLSAKDANYNTLRVWGGGLYYHDIVYLPRVNSKINSKKLHHQMQCLAFQPALM